MYITSLDRRYNLNEFNFYGTTGDSSVIYVLELFIDCSINEFEALSGVITVHDGDKTYSFEGFELNEWYKEGEGIKIVYVK